MRTLLHSGLAMLVLCAACGQKGPLVLPQKSVATPVLIRAPAADAASTPAPQPPAAPPAQAAPQSEPAPQPPATPAPTDKPRDDAEPASPKR